MSDLMFHLVDGSPVFRGDELYVHPKYIQQAGAKVRAEFKTDFDVVTVRSIPSGAVPSLPINALSREPTPEAVVMCEVAKALCIQPYDVSKRDIKIWNAAVLASRPDTEWTDAASTPTEQDYRELQAQHDQVQSRMRAALDLLREAAWQVSQYAPGSANLLKRIDALLDGQVPVPAVSVEVYRLSQEAKESLQAMIDYCLGNGIAMGMDEGFKSFEPELKHPFRVELESLCAMLASFPKPEGAA